MRLSLLLLGVMVLAGEAQYRPVPVPPEYSRRGYVVLSDGTRYEGFVYSSRDKPLRIFDRQASKYRDFRLSELDRISVSTEKNQIEQVWRWKQAGSDEKVFIDKWYIMHEYITTFFLRSGERISGDHRSPIYIVTPFRRIRKIFHDRFDGPIVTEKSKLEPPVYIKEVGFREEVLWNIAEYLRRLEGKLLETKGTELKPAESSLVPQVETRSLREALHQLYGVSFKQVEGRWLCSSLGVKVSLKGENKLKEACMSIVVRPMQERADLRFEELIMDGLTELVANGASEVIGKITEKIALLPKQPRRVSFRYGGYDWVVSYEVERDARRATLAIQLTWKE